MSCCCDELRGQVCHCPRCHQTFGSLALFDRHQHVDYMRNPAVSCRYPEDLGLLLDMWVVWRTPEDLRASTEKIARMNTRKATRA